MLHTLTLARSLDPIHPAVRRGVTRPVRAQSAQAQSAGEMQRRIEELLLQAEFSAAIGTLHDPNQVCSAACSWLRDVLGWEVLSVSTTEGEVGQYQYQVLHLDDALSRICPDLSPGAKSSTGKSSREIRWSDAGNNAVSICFPDRSGVLVLSRKSVMESRYSDHFLAGIAESLSRALFNAREYSRLKSLSMHDHLTGLYNRRVFEAMLEVEARKRSIKPFSLLLVDLDNFKGINDSYGHGAGDEVLVHVAEMLRQNFRKSDIPARYGGDEFSVLLPETPLDSALRVAERFRQSVASGPSALATRNFVPTVSVGIASVDDRSNLDVAHMVAEADRALYRAKAPGKNRVCGAKVERHAL